MASFKIDGFDFVTAMFDSMVNGAEDAAKKAVEAAAPILRDSAKAVVQKRTGDLQNSFEATKAKKNKYGTYSVVKPTGYNREGVSNYAVSEYLEFGTTKNGKQVSVARPWRQKAVNRAKIEAETTMEEVFVSEMEKCAK